MQRYRREGGAFSVVSSFRLSTFIVHELCRLQANSEIWVCSYWSDKHHFMKVHQFVAFDLAWPSGLEVLYLLTVAWLVLCRLICCIQQLLFIVSLNLSFGSRFSSCCSEDKCQSVVRSCLTQRNESTLLNSCCMAGYWHQRHFCDTTVSKKLEQCSYST